MAGTSPTGTAPAAVTFLYEDAELAVVDKPPGLTVVPAGGPAADRCLRDRVAAALGTRVWVVHRVDRDTSGVVVFARSAQAHRTLSMAFEARQVVKHYRALVAGVPQPSTGRIELALHEARRGKARPARPDELGARAAATSYELTRCWRHGPSAVVSCLAATPHTGRHHQIRVHLRAIGTPILGDAVYGRAATTEVPLPRLALHASAIDVPHPSDAARRVVIESPWPEDLGAVTRWLDAHWTVEP